jgi:hypothetical protein
MCRRPPTARTEAIFRITGANNSDEILLLLAFPAAELARRLFIRFVGRCGTSL